MDIVSGLIQKLESVPSLTSLLAYHADNTGLHAIYANVVPQNSKRPLLRVRQIDGEATQSFDGDTGLAFALLEVEIQTEAAQGYGSMQAIKEQLRLNCNVATGATWGDVPIQSSTLEDSIDDDFGVPEQGNHFIQGGGYQLAVWYSRTPVFA